MRIVLGTAVVALMLGAGTAFAQDDDKTYPGTACVPSKPAKAADFTYSKNSIRYDGTGRGKVDCHILREQLGAGTEMDSLQGYAHKASDGGAPLTCNVAYRSILNGAALTLFSFSFDNRGKTLFSAGFDYIPANGSVNVRCHLPTGSRVHGFKWVEDDGS